MVVTHHSPSPLTEDQYQATPLAGCFGSNLHHLMQEETAPVAWIHGHTHEDSDVVVGHTRVASRQRGYPDEKNFEDGWPDRFVAVSGCERSYAWRDPC